MGAICSQAAKVIAEAQQSPAQRKAQETYSQVVAAMEANEAANRERASTNQCNLAIFWVQSLLALCELPFRIWIHACLFGVYSVLACCTGFNPYVQFNAWRQQLLLNLYLCIFPNMLFAFVCNPCEPNLYIFGSDQYRLTRPPNPTFLAQSKRALMAKMGGSGGCCPCCGLSQALLTHLLGLPEADSTFFRWSFFFYGGLSACQTPPG